MAKPAYCTTAIKDLANLLRDKGKIGKKEFNQAIKDFYFAGGSKKGLSNYLRTKLDIPLELAIRASEDIHTKIDAQYKKLILNNKKSLEEVLKAKSKDIKSPVSPAVIRAIAESGIEGLSVDKFNKTIAKQLGTKLYSPQTIAKIKKLSKDFRAAKGEFEKSKISAEIEHEIASIENPKFMQQMETVRYATNLLADASTISTNIGANTYLNAGLFAETFLRAKFDPAYKKILDDAFYKAKETAIMAWRKDIFLDPIGAGSINPEKYRNSKIGNKFLNDVKKTTQIGMVVPDYFTYDLVYNKTLLEEMRSAKVKAPTQDMIDTAIEEAKRAILRDKTKKLGINFGEVLSTTVEGLNKIEVAGQKLKIGSLIQPFTHIIGNLAQRELAEGVFNLSAFAQLAIRGNNLSLIEKNRLWRRAKEGLQATGFVAIPSIMYSAGLLSPMALTIEEKRTQQARGIPEGALKVGDRYIDLSNITQPTGFQAKTAMRAIEAFKRISDVSRFIEDPKNKKSKEYDIWAKTLVAIAGDSMLKQIISNIRNTGYDLKNADPELILREVGSKTLDTFANMIGQYIPLGRQIKNITNTAVNLAQDKADLAFNVRESYDPNPFARIGNKLAGQYGFGTPRTSITGTKEKRLFSVGLIRNSVEREDKAAAELNKIQRATSEEWIKPPLRKIEGQLLSREQYIKAKEYQSKTRAYLVGNLVDNAVYQGIKDPLRKVEILKRMEGIALAGAGNYAVNKYIPKGAKKQALQILNGDIPKEQKINTILNIVLTDINQAEISSGKREITSVQKKNLPKIVESIPR